MTLPAWNAAGVLPPILPGAEPTGKDRSPYPVDLVTLQDRFATTPERESVFKGFLKFRAALHAAGIKQGFQWVNGSFTEDIERIESRPPHDVDVVTFFFLPDGMTQKEAVQRFATLFDRRILKQAYMVDAFFVELGRPMTESHVARIAYWYSLWSHRRDGRWKGFVQLDLNPQEDAAARTQMTEHSERNPS